MYTVMNVVHVSDENREAFERAFSGEGHVHKAEGFAGFELLRRDGKDEDEYAVVSRWESPEDFQAWVKSDLFKESHKHADGRLAHGSEVRAYSVVHSRVAL